MLCITEVSVLPVQNDEKLKAFVTIKISDCFILRDVKIINGVSGLFVAMPAKRLKDGTFKDIIHPLDKSTRKEVEKVILSAYSETMSKRNNGDHSSQRLIA